MLGVSLFLLSSAALPPLAVFHDAQDLVRLEVVLSDVLSVETLPVTFRARASALPVFTFAPGQAQAVLDVRSLTSRARAHFPAISYFLNAYQPQQISVQRSAGRLDVDLLSSQVPQSGAQSRIVVQSGPFRIVRDVTVLQSGKDGSRVFVRLQDGQVLSARCCQAEPK